MTHEVRPMNKNHNSQHHWPSLKAIALAATFAVLFSYIPANAYPQHQGEYLFWSEMPPAAQVMADMKGNNDLDTAARQHAALSLLMTLVKVDMNGKGLHDYTAGEKKLEDAYFAALPEGDGNGHVAEMRAESLKLQADPSFVQTFLKRYFSADALAEIQPVVASFEAGTQGQINPASAPKQLYSVFLKSYKQADEDDRKIMLALGFMIFTYLALTIIFGLLWMWRVCLAFGTIRTTSDDPPMIKSLGKNQKIHSFTGRVQGKETRSATTVSGSINTVGNSVQGSIRSMTTVTDTFRLVDPRNQQEENFMLENYHLQLFENQLVSVAWAIPENRTSGPFFLVINHTSNQVFTSRNDSREVAYPGYMRLITNWGLLTWFPFPANWVLVIYWEILMKVQVKRFRQSGIQPLVDALNQKAEEFS